MSEEKLGLRVEKEKSWIRLRQVGFTGAAMCSSWRHLVHSVTRLHTFPIHTFPYFHRS